MQQHPTSSLTEPSLGFGLGLRTQHFDAILNTSPEVDWFEVLSENFMVPGGKPRYYLQKIAERFPVVMHGVSMSVGGTDPLDKMYLHNLKTLANDINARWISDHLCWTSVHGMNSHDLLPLPYTRATVRHVSERIRQIQDYLGRRLVVENVSSYLSYQQSEMTEWEFLSEVAEASDCLILLDVNNIYVSARNHGFDALDYIDGMPLHRVQQIHLAGHTDAGNIIIDTHDQDVCDPVWNLYRAVLERTGNISSMIERDGNIPALPVLLDELKIARTIAHRVQALSSEEVSYG